VILNPRAAAAPGGRRREPLERAVRAVVRDVEFVDTRGPGDATVRAREALERGAEMIVAVGGDGTYSETVNGFFDAEGAAVNPEAVLAVLPGGTGGDFRKTLGYGRDPLEMVALLGDRAVRAIDAGRLTYTAEDGSAAVRHFLNIASFGLSGEVDRRVNRSSKALGGFLSFGSATLGALVGFRPQGVRLRIDGRPEAVRRISVVAVANGRFFGGGMQIAPEARIDDGLFDVVTLEGLGMGDFLLKGHRVYAGTHLGLAGVICEPARRVEAEPLDPDEPVLLDVDGEAPGRLPATFEILPGALRLKA
jgi:YegS/Rv2252/BmrU family lipid kinase